MSGIQGSPNKSHFVVRKTGGGENGNLLATGNGVHGVDGRDTSLDHFFGVDTRERVDGLTWKQMKPH
jgi:hypothetical protein